MSYLRLCLRENEFYYVSAVLDVYSISKGFLLPRMTEEEINSISPLEAGLFVCCSEVIVAKASFFSTMVKCGLA